MHAVVPHHVVSFARISEEVGLRTSLCTGFEERQRMLWHYGRIVVAYDNLELAFQLSRLADEAGLGIALRIALGRAHVALAIHHLVPLPVDDGAAGYANLEHIGIVGHERDGHEAAKRPAMNPQTGHVHIGQGAQKLNTLHLVLHLYLAQLAVSGLLEVASAIL